MESITAVQARIEAVLSAAQALQDYAHHLIAALDLFDGDTDLESDLANDHDGQALEHATDDDEPSLGWTGGILQSGPSWTGQAAQPFDIDREDDPAHWGIGDRDGLIEQGGSIYEFAT